MKPSLTFEEKITVAYLHHVHGVEQQLLGIATGVNMGRINEACVAVEEAFNPKQKATASYLARLV
jgi:hypothetical protein